LGLKRGRRESLQLSGSVLCSKRNHFSAAQGGRERVCLHRARSYFFNVTLGRFVGLQRALHSPGSAPMAQPRNANNSMVVWTRAKLRVKKKTQNVVDVFVLRLFVVVLFLLKPSSFSGFREHKAMPDWQLRFLESRHHHGNNFGLVTFSSALAGVDFRNSSRRRNLRPRAPLYADHSGSPVSRARAARTAASLESRSSM